MGKILILPWMFSLTNESKSGGQSLLNKVQNPIHDKPLNQTQKMGVI